LLLYSIDANSSGTWESFNPDHRELSGRLKLLLAEALGAMIGEDECQIGRAETELQDHRLGVEICAEVGGFFAELMIAVSGLQPQLMAQAIQQALVGIPPEIWQLVPDQLELTFHARLTLAQIALADQPAWQDDPNRPAHIVLERHLPQALVAGSATLALCGFVFSPTETGEGTRSREVCPLCAALYLVVTPLIAPPA
jgi:hypothetical protein